MLGVSEDTFQRDRQREEDMSQRVRALGTRFNRLNTYVTMLEQSGPEPAPTARTASSSYPKRPKKLPLKKSKPWCRSCASCATSGRPPSNAFSRP
ncbi:hypothetical protein MUN84_17750 [Hymenobacter sp. 5516J-16]|uniref:hypothetical protein n=1 Tax=Hymenobacter sp. 5516J-16 TaxID=2932253 RepID=UPI001FCFCF90|nr:hypothetical protein [Hymenobacter sp. 5516J-16]UOQ76382.1 hypothetical protein MUN84_17750 [Hymenobacter sp. 5516J-16]